MTTKREPWAPYQPTANDPWDPRKVAHLHRRAGFGATWAELQPDLKAGPAESVDRLFNPVGESVEEREVLASLRQGVLTSRETEVERLKAYWLYRILFHPDVLREKMTLFWHNHFATSNAKVKSVPLHAPAERAPPPPRSRRLRGTLDRDHQRPGDARVARRRRQSQGEAERKLRP